MDTYPLITLTAEEQDALAKAEDVFKRVSAALPGVLPVLSLSVRKAVGRSGEPAVNYCLSVSGSIGPHCHGKSLDESLAQFARRNRPARDY